MKPGQKVIVIYVPGDRRYLGTVLEPLARDSDTHVRLEDPAHRTSLFFPSGQLTTREGGYRIDPASVQGVSE